MQRILISASKVDATFPLVSEFRTPNRRYTLQARFPFNITYLRIFFFGFCFLLMDVLSTISAVHRLRDIIHCLPSSTFRISICQSLIQSPTWLLDKLVI
jgi:hypothetical protein